jgi:hypothetical protein
MADVTTLPETVVTAQREPDTTTLPETVVTAQREKPDTTVLFSPFAGVRCVVEVYPFEGGKWTIQEGNILSCAVSKPRDGSGGTFDLVLAPGGPLGTEGSPTWSQIITPMSFVLIGMQRGENASIVMIGVVRAVAESQVWATAGDGSMSMARRGQSIQGADFSYYFLTNNYAAMTLFGISSGNTFGNAWGISPSLAFPASVAPGTIGGTQDAPSNPSQVAEAWYRLMMGPLGAMGKSFVPYWPPGFRLNISEITKRIFEDYPAGIPMGASFLAAEGSWMAKFRDILKWPWYEFFITTGPVDAYEETFDKGEIVKPDGLIMTLMPKAKPACPIVVARVNPVPVQNCIASTMGGPITLGTINVDRWSKLIVYDMAGAGFLSSQIGFSLSDARNVYWINPISMVPLYNNNANTSPAPYLFTSFGDPASIHRYGFRPELVTTDWWFDPLGQFAQKPADNIALSFAQGIADCLLMAVGQYHPTPFMARGRVTIPLRPDILPGNVFRYSPFKLADTWDFYIDTVAHGFIFGGRSTTTLSLSRGLPSKVYVDTTAGGLLESIWTGEAQRVDGEYKKGLPEGTAPGLLTIESTNESITRFLGAIGQAYVTPMQ